MKKRSWLYSFAVILGVWTLAYYGVHRPFIPSPLKVILYFQSHWPTLLNHLGASFFRIITAILITVIVGGLIGILIARNKRLDQLVSPLIYTLYPIPKIAFLPLLMLFLGLGNTSKITLVAMILFFQIVISIRDSVKAIPEPYFMVMQSLKGNAYQTYQHVILPAILPSLFTALRISVGTSISVLFFAENFATQTGIGYFIMDAWLKLDYTGMFAGIIAISLMGGLIFYILDTIQHKVCAWNQ